MRFASLVIVIMSVLFLSGCGSKDVIIQNQQKQLDELSKKIENMATSTQPDKKTNEIKNSPQIIERIIERPVVIEKQSDNSELLSQIEGLRSQLSTINSQPTQQQPISNSKIIASYLSKTVKLWCSVKGLEGLVGGSGSIISKTGKITTNQHVVEFVGNLCIVGLTTSVNQPPTAMYFAKVIDTYETIDLASLQIVDEFNEQNPAIKGQFDPATLNLPYIKRSDFCQRSSVQIGDKLTVIGYPGVGGSTITATEGTVSGFEDLFIKTSAKIAHGNSGGLAVHESGCFLGVPVGASTDDLESLGRIIDFTESPGININDTKKNTETPTDIGSESGGGASPSTVDSDGDGLSDYDETNKWKTDPNKADTDGDGFSDGAEVNSGFNPNGAGKLY